MCGIAGAIDPEEHRAAARVRMLNESQAHRGPDHMILTRVGIFTLGNTRLAIQDPSPAGNQPFVSVDGRYHCVFNGEIYNYHRLIERYQLPVRTKCDGEVIPELWAKLGAASLAELRGMFALALVDSLEERLYLARDPFGIKPLHWRVLPDGTLIFASEVRTLARAAAGVRIDCAAVARYLHLGAMAPDQSPFQEIVTLPPRSFAAVGRDSQVTVRPILPDGQFREPGDLGCALVDSIDLHLSADVPTALLLSSGVDSATIAAVSHRLGRDLHCLTVATQGAADESAEAAETARRYGHSFQRVPAALGYDDVVRFFEAMQRPSIDGLNTYVVSKAVHDAGFKVALSGLGGDEAVGGYSHFRLLRYLPALRALHKMPSLVTDVLAKAVARTGVASEVKTTRLLGNGGPSDGRGLSLLQREVLSAPLVADLTGVDDRPVLHGCLEELVPIGSPFGAMVAAEIEFYLQSTLLPDADSFSMASSVELRVPFVDRHVFKASANLAADRTTRPGKAAIGTALGDPYLLELAARPKRGFSIPMKYWMAGPLLPVLSAADDPDAPVWLVVDRAAAEHAGMIPHRALDRWAETWVLAALNGWLESVGAGLVSR